MNKWFRWIVGIAASPVILFILLALLLYLPPVQRWAVGIATHYASESTGMDISIEDVRLRFPLDLQLGGVMAIQPNDSLPQQKDTLVNAERIICEVQLRPLLHSDVQVDILQMNNVSMNTATLIPDCRVKGRVGNMLLTSHGIDLKRDTMLLNKAVLDDANLDICLADTAQEDTIKKPNPDWKIRIQNLGITNSRVLLHMPGDTLNIAADVASLTARDAFLDLYENAYFVSSADLKHGNVTYVNRFKVKQQGFDANHIKINNLNVGVDTIAVTLPDISLKLRACNGRESSGIAVRSLTGTISMDSLGLSRVNATLDAEADKQLLETMAGSNISSNIFQRWHTSSATLHAEIEGNLKQCQLNNTHFDLPGIFGGNVTGTLHNLDTPSNLRLDTRMHLTAFSNSSITADARLSLADMRYGMNLDISKLNLNNIVPGMHLGTFSGAISAKGRGLDVFSPKTQLTASGTIRSFRYSQFNLSGSTFRATLQNGRARADINTSQKTLDTHLLVDAKVNRKTIDAHLKADVRNIDFYALRLTKAPFTMAVNAAFELQTDLKDNYRLRGAVTDLSLTDSTGHYTPDDMHIDVLTRRDTTSADVACGDFLLHTNFNAGYKRLTAIGNRLMKEIDRQINGRIIDENAFRSKLPVACIRIKSGRENPVARMLGMLGYKYAMVDADIDVSSHSGINGYVSIDTLLCSGMQFDDIDLRLTSDDSAMSYALRIVNDKDNPSYTFTADVVGALQQNGTTMAVKLDDEKGRRGVDVQLEATMEQDDIRISVLGDKPLLAYTPFTINKGNYIRLGRDMRVSADVTLVGPQGTGIQIYTNDENTEALQDVTLSLNRLDLHNLSSSLPFMPKLTGMLNSDFHFIQEPNQMSISTDADFIGLTVEGSMLGDFTTELVYMPLDDGTHHIDGVLIKDGMELATIQGSYSFGEADRINADLDLSNMPMDYINGFIPNQIVGMKGTGTGRLSIEGLVSRPVVNGTLDLSEARVISVPYGVELKMDSDPIRIVNSTVVFDDYRLESSNKSPLVVNGNLDFTNLSRITTDLRVKGDNVQIINAKETRRSEAYGKAFVNFMGNITGSLDRLNVKAQVDVLPSTALYYILRDSPLDNDNRMKELVTFTDFSEETIAPVVKSSPEGISMDMNLNIIDGSHVICYLNDQHSNYLDLYGNGELRFTYARQKMNLTGRYTFTQGEMKYSLPVIPLKTFNIHPDSYIEFQGDVMNPTLSITATERNRATATINNNNVSVDFECGVVLSKKLRDMGLEFIINAPNDNSVSDQLSILSKEERAKLAVGMLTTGMFLDQSNSKFNVGSALGSFLQNEISNIAGSAMKSLDFAVGLENSATPDGNMSFDYSFKFAKRFWNNRVSVAVGGRITTGAQTAGRTPSFFDNVEVQYRLSETSNQYLQLFYKHDVYDYLEGYLDHFGAGYIWKRKLQSIKDIFPKSSRRTSEPTDTLGR